jgi:NAD(P)-dependent dehydrogenase (short-subunit alcohol dehydrogenase family)
MSKLCEGRVVIVTGAGRGLGRSHALAFARAGARLVVNDVDESAEAVCGEIRALGGEAVPSRDDIADWEGAKRLVGRAIESFGRHDVLVNNAGFVRDRMLVSCSEEEWDAVTRVHLKGHFAPTRHALDHWRARAKAGEPVQARVINTSSGAGLAGSMGQAAYSAAKAGIAALTLVEAAELGRYGITANAIAPAARTRMTEQAFPEMMKKPDRGFDAMDPDNVSPIVVWLGSTDSEGVTGRVFEVQGGMVRIAEGWRRGPEQDKGARWEPEEVGRVVRRLLSKTELPQKVYGT